VPGGDADIRSTVVVAVRRALVVHVLHCSSRASYRFLVVQKW
jgi:hypothetical protein